MYQWKAGESFYERVGKAKRPPPEGARVHLYETCAHHWKTALIAWRLEF